MEERLIIVGTAHVSKRSIEEVLEVIEKEKPDAVAVELCPRRYYALFNKPEISIREALNNISLTLFQVILAYLQQKIGREVGVKPGSEIVAAIEKAKEMGIDVILIDRDVGITFSRLWNSLNLLEKIKLFIYLFKGKDFDIDEMVKRPDLLVEEFRKISPKAAKILIDERDAYMAYCLREALNKYRKIVAVVGAGHKRGIEEKINEKIDLKEILEVKRKRINIFKIFALLFSIFVATLFILLAFSSTQEVLEALKFWFLINGLLASSGALIARAHPLSVLTAFLTAWLTSLNPFIAAGWLSGIVEAWKRKLTIDDILKLKDEKTFSDLMKNKFFRVLLVAALTNVGSIAGTIYGSYYIMTNYNISVQEFINYIFKK
ncbi:MAG: TraB/GumN family protein [Archaeoglobaceae archaeon]|nr:TraB/GumN family protein [Archaeoglobaceae archaeon]MCX8151525.1 TraB/GumN family protein [Archaeoglobaceae archaeon]MDW8013239.1 TraB/GumN family protein [Archaeoglobaceae archaeon]